jgi:hypothetical protein
MASNLAKPLPTIPLGPPLAACAIPVKIVTAQAAGKFWKQEHV